MLVEFSVQLTFLWEIVSSFFTSVGEEFSDRPICDSIIASLGVVHQKKDVSPNFYILTYSLGA